MSWLSRFTNVFRSGRLNRELEEELESHIEERTEDLIRQGLSAGEAAAQARRQFGNKLVLRESSRDAKLFSWLESIFHDARFGLRMLLKDRTVTAAAVLSLSLAIGASTAAFSLIDALLLRKLPVRDPDRLVAFTFPEPFGRPLQNDTFNYPLYRQFRDASAKQADLFGVTYGGPLRPVTFDDSGGQEEKVRPEWITGNGFDVLGVRPSLGRLFTDSDGRSHGKQGVAVLSYNFWTRRFGRSPAVLGRWLTWNDSQLQIVGVAAKGFHGVEPGYASDLWVPIEPPANPNEMFYSFRVWARPKPGVTAEQVRQVLQATFTNFRREHVKETLRPGAPSEVVTNFLNAPLNLRAVATGAPTMVRMEFTRPLWILAIVVALVLLIACSNVANLQTARAAAREREMAMRLSIGAGRMRLIQQLLIESSLLAAAACILGLAFASWAAPPIVNLLSPSSYPAYLDLRIDWRMLAFLALLGIATTVLFGLIPALRASAVSPHEALKAGSGKQSGRIGILRPLLAAQVGFSFMVLFVGGLLLLSFQRLTSVDLGFSKDRVVLVDIQAKDLAGEKARIAALQLLDHVRQLPNVEAASLSAQGLIGGNFAWVMTPAIRFAGREPEAVKPRYLAVSPGFFQAMQIRFLDGRDLAARDTEPASTAVVVNQTFARTYFPGENILGKRFEKFGDDPKPVAQEVVGVIRDAKFNNLREAAAPTVYEPLRRLSATLEVRTSGDPLSAISSLRDDIQRFNAALHVAGVTLQSTQIENTLLRERLLALLSGFFALVAVVLAAVGLYGVLSYSVVRRTKEIGIRVALGARQARVVRLVISDILLIIGAGIAAGMAGGLALARYVASLLFEVKPSDFWSLALPLACLLLVSTLAALAPAVRAARVDPMVALRYE
ncbi:MAG TPA: ABC transporter permease [Bryobacteraceae bacterium]|nr:ABC transporter permease [Bryobacteraceae bacterium]